MAIRADWIRQDDKLSEIIAAIGCLSLGILCISSGHWGMRGQQNSWVVTGLGVMFLGMFVVGVIVRPRSTIEIFVQQRFIRCHSSTRFGSKVATFPFSDLMHIELTTYRRRSDEISHAYVFLLFRNGRKEPIPLVSINNGNSIAQELAQLTGAKVIEKHSDTRWIRRAFCPVIPTDARPAMAFGKMNWRASIEASPTASQNAVRSCKRRENWVPCGFRIVGQPLPILVE